MRRRMTLCLAVTSITLTHAVAALHAESFMQIGWIRSADTPIAESNVTLYVAGNQNGSGEVVLGSSPTSAEGFFIIPFDATLDANSVLYVIADGPSATTRLATVIGSEPNLTGVTINERSTVATAVTMAQFIDGTSIGGKWPGLQNSAATLRNLVNVSTGDVAEMLGSPPNGLETSTMRAFNSLANMLAGCVNSQADCALLFDLATPPGPNGTPPTNTLQAAVNIAHNAWQNPVELFEVSQGFAPYQPALTEAPRHWALAIKYVGNGKEFDGPGAMAFDERGDVWITNNYIYKKNHFTPSCAGNTLLKLTAIGADAPGAPYKGTKAGLSGAGFGITLDPTGNVWVGNFGFFGNTCPENLRPPANSVSLFDRHGTPLSPREGFTQGCISSPQATVSDHMGNIWIANTCDSSVTRYAAGNPNDHWVFDIASGSVIAGDDCPPFSGDKPFGIAIDADGNAWVTNNTGDSAFKLSNTGQLLATVGPETGIKAPMGVAIDSRGHVWISNSGIVDVPCAKTGVDQIYGSLLPDLDHASVTELDANGVHVGTYRGGGIVIPWGIAVDGNDNIWVANFGGQLVSQFDGATGLPIAPHGYFSDGLMRITGVSIDPSGNVWLTNNWLIDAVQTNPGGDGLMVFIGLAGPVKTPLFGPPQLP
jgi:streptogramin lyase